MFTGIINNIGVIKDKRKVLGGLKFRIDCKIKGLKISDSISINGVCHTVTKKDSAGFEVISIPETIKKTTMPVLKIKDKVNLETSLKAGDDIGGHFVYGHIDDTGIIDEIRTEKGTREYFIKLKNKYKNLVVSHGSIAVNGVSLTIADINNTKDLIIKTAIIPYTYKKTTFKELKVNDKVNIEFDYLLKKRY